MGKLLLTKTCLSIFAFFICGYTCASEGLNEFLSDLNYPLKIIKSARYFDGGSVSVELVDSQGKQVFIFAKRNLFDRVESVSCTFLDHKEKVLSDSEEEKKLLVIMRLVMYGYSLSQTIPTVSFDTSETSNELESEEEEILQTIINVLENHNTSMLGIGTQINSLEPSSFESSEQKQGAPRIRL